MIELFVKAVTIRLEEKTPFLITKPVLHTIKPKMIITITTTTTPVFQHIKTTEMLFLAQATLAKTYYMLENLEKMVNKRLFI